MRNKECKKYEPPIRGVGACQICGRGKFWHTETMSTIKPFKLGSEKYINASKIKELIADLDKRHDGFMDLAIEYGGELPLNWKGAIEEIKLIKLQLQQLIK